MLDILNKLSDKAILKVPVSDLAQLSLGKTYQLCHEQLYRELDRRKIAIHPHIWIGDEWFSPDRVAGFALPYYLLHPRLQQIERKHGLSIEGISARSHLMLCRHETAHALDNAFGLRGINGRKEIFGNHKIPYPEYYEAIPYSKKFVKHLPGNYAQAHPEEDWAETFATWLTPKNIWMTRYQNWPAMMKLLFVEKTIKTYCLTPPKRCIRTTPYSIELDHRTIGELIRDKKSVQKKYKRAFFSSYLEQYPQNKRPSNKVEYFFRENQELMISNIAKRTGQYHHRIKVMLDRLKEESIQGQIVLKQKDRKSIEKLLVQVSSDFIDNGHARILM